MGHRFRRGGFQTRPYPAGRAIDQNHPSPDGTDFLGPWPSWKDYEGYIRESGFVPIRLGQRVRNSSAATPIGLGCAGVDCVDAQKTS